MIENSFFHGISMYTSDTNDISSKLLTVVSNILHNLH